MIDPRARITERINRARVELELRRAVGPAGIVLVGLAVGLALALYVIGNVSRNTLADTYEVRFVVDDATAVRPNVHEVRFKGVPAGTITSVEMEGDHPVITAEIREEYGRLYRDARAELRPNTPLQDMFLDIVDRGSPQAGKLEDGEALPPSQVRTPVSISDVLNIFQRPQRHYLGVLLDQLGNGLADRGAALRRVFAETAPLLAAAGDITRQLAERKRLVSRLVNRTATLTTELARRDDALRRLVKEGSVALTALQASSGDLDATLRELPAAVRGVDAGLAAVQGVLDDVDGALSALRPAVRLLPTALHGLRDLGQDAKPAVRALERPVRALVPLADVVEPLARDLDRSLELLEPQIDTIDHTTEVAVRCKKGFQNFFQWNASISKFGDSRGPIPRGNLVIGLGTSAVVNDPLGYAPEACSGGEPAGGRPVTKEDMR